MRKIVLFIFVCSSLFSCSVIKHSPGKAYKKATGQPYDVVIIPGFPHDGKEWNEVIKFRLLWAVHLYENNLAKNFIFSGGAVHTPYNEGHIMAMYAIKMGIPKERIIIEPNAKHSSENVYYSLKVAEEFGFKRIAVATDPIQGFLLTNYTERIRHQKIDFINLNPKHIRKYKFSDEPKINISKAYVENFVPLKEQEDFWTRKRSSLGLNIDYGMPVDKYLKYSKWFKW
ncbi:MAG: YdcF family protein [Bacteroidia bacterium]|nr:YdcF family protein [Bacteroidia bacterium]